MVPDWLQALILGIVQGLTEFIPVSSSGHLVLVPYLAGWEHKSLAFDVLLHVGTMAALLVYFRGELAAIIKGILGLDRSEQGRIYRKVGWLIIPASIPAAVLGVTLEEQIGGIFESPLAACFFLLCTAGLLFALEFLRDRRVARGGDRSISAEVSPAAATHWDGDWRGSATPVAAERSASSDLGSTAETIAELPLGVDEEDPNGVSLAGLTLTHAVAAGLFQALALLPGISRSGSTIAGGVISGLTREAATRFSFLMVIPVLFGATLLSLDDLGSGGESLTTMAVGMIAAAISGYAAIRYLVALVSRASLRVFGWYCLAASAVGFLGYAMIG